MAWPRDQLLRAATLSCQARAWLKQDLLDRNRTRAYQEASRLLKEAQAALDHAFDLIQQERTRERIVAENSEGL